MKYPTLFTAIVYISASASATPLVVNNANGVTYQGTSANGVEQFQNIFFGKSTAGERRFSPPQPYVPPNNSTINATAPGLACPQLSTGNVFVADVTIDNVSEDCLSLKIGRPTGTSATDKLPVMVWIYGGGNTLGQIYDPTYNPTGLISQSVANGKPVIYAAVNYRLNLFGFASSDTLRDARSLNVGLRDQRLGIQWVKDNIHIFGGDPDNITIFGESDGATGVGLQLTAFGGKRRAPFHRAIMQSGAATTDTGTNSNTSATGYATVAALTNCTRGSPGSAETLACMRNLPLETLLNATFTYAIAKSPPFGFSVYFPVVDNDFIPAAPSTLLKTGRFSKHISVINGWTTDDGSLFSLPTITNDSAIAAYLAFNYPGLQNSTIARILALYPASDFDSEVAPDDTVNVHFYRASRMFRDSKFTCPCIDLSYHVMKYSNARAWLYELDQTAFAAYWASVGSKYLGVSHASDIPYVYNEAAAFNGTSSDILLGTQISGDWSTFAATGMPTDAAAWPVAYSRGNFMSPVPQEAIVNVLGGPNAGPASVSTDSCKGPVGMEKILLRCAFWTSIYDELRV